MQRTLGRKYAAVLSGEIVLRLDGGEKTIRAGEFIVQQGAPIKSGSTAPPTLPDPLR